MNRSGRICRHFFWVMFSLFFLFANNHCLAETADIDWNGKQIKWQSYSQGMAKAKSANRPVIMVLYTDWCPTCKNYSAVFKDSKVVKESAQFVMIKVNTSQNPQISSQYSFDGEYIPRTIALSPSGEVLHQLYPDKEYRYFIPATAQGVLRLMQGAHSSL